MSAALAQVKPGDTVTFGEGDPLLQADVLTWLTGAKEAGAATVGVQTTGHVLAKKGAASQLKSAGLTDVHVILLGADAASHDWISGSDGSFRLALRGIKRANAAGLRTHILAPILRPTFRALPDLVRRSLALHVRSFAFHAPLGTEREAHGLHPHLALAGPHVQRAIALARLAKRRATTWGVPACVLADQSSAMQTPRSGHIVIDAAMPTTDYRDRIHGAPCNECGLRAHCPGPLATYAEQFGWGGLVPQQDATPK